MFKNLRRKGVNSEKEPKYFSIGIMNRHDFEQSSHISL